MAGSIGESIGEFFHKGKIALMLGIGFVARKTMNGVDHISPIAMAVSYGVSLWANYSNYSHEKNRLAECFDAEISAQLGKPASTVNQDDLEEMAARNPIIAEAMHRNQKKFFNNFLLSSIGLTVAVFASGAIIGASVTAGALAAGGGAAIALGMALGLALYEGSKFALKPLTTRIFGIAEPDLDDVRSNPELQHKLSPSSQIRLLVEKQKHIDPKDPSTFIGKDEIFTLFVATNPELADQIEKKYGSSFADLQESAKASAIKEYGQVCNLDSLSDDINNKLVRVQELTFAVYNRESGVAKLESPHLSTLEKMNLQLQHNLEIAKQKASALGEHITEKASDLKESVADKVADLGATIKEKIGFKDSEVSGVVPGNQVAAKQAIGETPGFSDQKRNQPGRTTPQEIIARKQRQNLGGFSPAPA